MRALNAQEAGEVTEAASPGMLPPSPPTGPVAEPFGLHPITNQKMWNPAAAASPPCVPTAYAPYEGRDLWRLSDGPCASALR